VDEHIPYEELLTNMKKINDEQQLIVNDIIYIYIETFTHFLNKRCRNKKNFYINVYHKKMLRCYIKDIPNGDPLKQKVMKLTYTRKFAFNINGMTIHSTFAILLNKNFNELKTLNDEYMIV